MCVACNEGCDECVVITSTPLTTECTQCSSGWFEDDGECTETCSDGKWRNQLTNLCVSCTAPCENCKSEDKCTSCNEGFVINNNECLECPSHCTVCSLPDTDVCDTCETGFFVNSAGGCTECIEGCSTCSDETTCDVCDDSGGWFLNAAEKCVRC